MRVQLPKPTLDIITPMSRPENLMVLWESIREHVSPFFDAKWYIVADTDNQASFFGGYEIPIAGKNEPTIVILNLASEGNGLSGNPQRNLGLDMLESRGQHVYFLDDDNVVHPNYGKIVSTLLKIKPSVACSGCQAWPNGQIRLWANQGNMQPGGLDTAQMTIPFDMIGEHRWDAWDYCADGVFFSKIFRDNPVRWVFIPDTTCWYNYLGKT